MGSQSYIYSWEWLGPGGPPGLQNRCRVAVRAVVGSTPIHSRLDCLHLVWSIANTYDSGRSSVLLCEDQPE